MPLGLSPRQLSSSWLALDALLAARAARAAGASSARPALSRTCAARGPIPGALILLGLLLTWPCWAREEPRQVYIPDLQREVPALAQRLSQLEESRSSDAAPEVLAGMIHRLLVACWQERAGRFLVWRSKAEPLQRARALREILLDLALQLPPPGLTSLRALQQASVVARLRTRGGLALEQRLEAYPFSEAAAEASLAQWGRAVEANDQSAASALSAFLLRVHPHRRATVQGYSLEALTQALCGDRARAMRALDGLRAAPRPTTSQGERARAELCRRTEVAVQSLLLESAPSQSATPARSGAMTELVLHRDHLLTDSKTLSTFRSYSPTQARLVAGRVCVSTGARLSIFSRSGDPLGAFPQSAKVLTDPPRAQTAFVGSLAAWGAQVFTPLVFERWLTPARKGSRSRDPALANRFYSLLAFDVLRGRLMWWDGDPGARGSGMPPGWGRSSPQVRALLSRGHTVACLADGARVYAAILNAAEDPELHLIAFRRATSPDQPLTLESAWAQPAFVLSAERRSQGSSADPAIEPEVGAALALDERGHLVCTTDVGVTACVEATSGRLLWAHQSPAWMPARTRRSPQSTSNASAAPAIPPEPAHFVADHQGKISCISINNKQLIAAAAHDGSLRWIKACGPAKRLETGDKTGWILAYGPAEEHWRRGQHQLEGSELLLYNAEGDRLTRLTLPLVCLGRLAMLKDSLIIPLLDEYGRGSAQELHVNYGILELGKAWSLGLRDEPFNLLATQDGLVASSSRRILFCRWEREE